MIIKLSTTQLVPTRFSSSNEQQCKTYYTKTSGAVSFGETRPKWKCLDIMDNTTLDKTSTSTQTPLTTCQHRGGEVMIRACFPATGPGHLADTEVNMNSFIPRYFRVKCEALCLITRA